MRTLAIVVLSSWLVGAGPAYRPVIGAPKAVPAVPAAGERFIVSFKVFRNDSGAPLTRGTMTCEPAIDGVLLNHAESFRGGVARLSFLVPEAADGRRLTVRVAIRADNGATARRVARFRIPAAPLPALRGRDVSTLEGNVGTTTLAFPVTLSGPSRKVVTVDYTTADGTATAGSDYAAASGTIGFAPGEVAKTISVAVVGDRVQEPDETFTLRLSHPVNAALGNDTATGTIVGDEVVLVAPESTVPVPQSIPSSGCGLTTRGYGIVVTFVWRTSGSPDVTAYRLFVQHRGSTIPIVDAGLGGDTTTYTYRSCDAYVADPNLESWEWTVTAVNALGAGIGWATGTFSFAPCRLPDGTGCHT